MTHIHSVYECALQRAAQIDTVLTEVNGWITSRLREITFPRKRNTSRKWWGGEGRGGAGVAWLHLYNLTLLAILLRFHLVQDGYTYLILRRSGGRNSRSQCTFNLCCWANFYAKIMRIHAREIFNFESSNFVNFIVRGRVENCTYIYCEVRTHLLRIWSLKWRDVFSVFFFLSSESLGFNLCLSTMISFYIRSYVRRFKLFISTYD